MTRALAVLPAGTWDAAREVDRVLIDYDRRHRRRFLLPTERGAEVLLDLPQAVRLRQGDGLALEEGGVVRVVARPENLAEIHAHDSAALMRIAWHLGNRHLPVQFDAGKIRIRADHVIEDMVRHLGGHVHSLEAPFDPEGGAYAPTLSITTRTTMTTTDLLRLITWLSPAFPTGAYAWSHGIEWAVEAGDVRDHPTLRDWLDDVLRHGAGRTDAILLRHAHRVAFDEAPLDKLAELALAAQPGLERQAESASQGTAFAAAATAWGAPLLAYPYPIAVGALARRHSIAESAACAGLLHALATNLVSAAVRLVPLGQSDGLRVLAALEPAILDITTQTEEADLEDIGGACFRADLASLRHETQYTRLFRS